MESHELLNQVHQVLLENTMIELVNTNATAKKRFKKRNLEGGEKSPFDRNKAEREELLFELKKLTRKNNFIDIASYIFLYNVAKADGTICVEEEERIMSLLELGEEDYSFANSLASYRKSEGALIKIIQSSSVEEVALEKLVGNLFEVAMADGHISDSENTAINAISRNLGVTDTQLSKLRTAAETKLAGSARQKRYKLNAAVDELNFDDL